MSNPRNKKHVAFAKGTKSISNGASAKADTVSDDKTLDPPTFRLPATDLSNGNNENRYELWTIRLPSAVDIQDLEGSSLQLDPSNPSSSNFESNGIKYSFQWGHSVENESFRVLVPAATAKDDSDESDSDSDEGGKKKKERYLIPLPTPFQRHLNVVTAVTLSETDLAPRVDNAPTAIDDVRRAYAHVPQKTGLKRRWMPLGGIAFQSAVASATGTAVAVKRVKEEATSATQSSKRNEGSSSLTEQSPKRYKKENEVMNSDDLHSGTATSIKDAGDDLSAGKKARKEAKKAEKEAKKAKKAEKKAKKGKKLENKIEQERTSLG